MAVDDTDRHRRVDDAEHRSFYGYGLKAPNKKPGSFPVQQITDANMTFRNQMSPSEGDRYDAALLGTPSSEKPIYDSDKRIVGNYRADGCLAVGIQTVFGVEEGTFQTDLDLLDNARNDLIERLSSDGRWQAIWKAWSGCMAVAGYALADRSAAVQSAMQALQSRSFDWNGGTDEDCG